MTMFKLASILLLVSCVQAEDSSIRGGIGSESSGSNVKASSSSSSFSSPVHGTSNRRLQVDSLTVKGECSFETFLEAANNDLQLLANLLGASSNEGAVIENAITNMCETVLGPSTDLVDVIGMGPQFLKNYLDGGTTWNDHYEQDDTYNLANDTTVIDDVDYHHSEVFGVPDGGTSATYPRYFSNFYRLEEDEECPLGVIECCYTGSREEENNPFVGNAEICAFDLETAAHSNHIKARSATFYDTASNQAYCSAFAYDKGSFGEAVKYNTLFHMTMKMNLREKALVKNIPGAPLCGCVEQMPIVSNADCIKAVEGYTLAAGEIRVNIEWDACGTDLVTYYNTLSRGKMEKYFVKKQFADEKGCEHGGLKFMNDRMLVPIVTE